MRRRCTWAVGLIGALMIVDSVRGDTWFVDQNTPAIPEQNGQSWKTAYADLQQLFDDPDFQTDQTNREVWVANGTYKPSVQYRPNPNEPSDPRTVTYVIPSGVEVYGGFRGYTSEEDDGEDFRFERNPEVNLTILSGDIVGDDDESTFPNEDNDPNTPLIYDDDAYHVVTIPEAFTAGGPTRVSGFVIRGGYADGGETYGHATGGGVKSRLIEFDPENNPVGNVQFNRLAVKYNYASQAGGGIYVSVKDATYKVANCRFEHNFVGGTLGGGGFYSDSTLVSLMNCTFWNNHALGSFGGGAHITGNVPGRCPECGRPTNAPARASS